MTAVATGSYYALVEDVVGRLEEALSGGAVSVTAATRAQRVALGLRLGLISRAYAVGTLADTPTAHAAMYDSLRAMCEAAGHLSWMVDVLGAVEERSGCIELGQVRAEVNNRTKLLTAHGASWVDEEERRPQADALESAKRMLAAAQRAHASPCRHCGGSGRDQGHAAAWLRQRATREGARRAELDLYSLWVGCSADTHQLVPQRFARDDGNWLELTTPEVARVVTWAIRVLLTCAPMIAGVVRAESVPEVEAVATWWDDLMRALASTAEGAPGNAE
jgi:hypothetical protein